VTEPPLIEVERVGKVYPAADGRPVRAITSVSFSVGAGEFIAILGPSGCGKSTLLMMVAGLLAPTEGRVLVRGRPLTEPQNDFGIVFQDPVLFPWRTVQSNVELPAEVAGIPRAQRAENAVAIIGLVGLAGFESKFPDELSGGMQQRVAIARALSLKPSLLLMDEPFGALDAITREQMNLELQRISLQSKATVIFVTHSLSEAVFLADRVLVMSGRPATLRESLPVGVPRPRPLEFTATEAFGKHLSHLRRLLEITGSAS
jgi:NitT/TauT family transport system ATP-binding protein